LFCLALLLLMPSACTDADSSAAVTTTSTPPDVGIAPVTTVATTTTIVPDPTGVPGLGASDPFCAAWAAYAGTLQALGVASSFGGLTVDQLAVLELRAAPRLVEAAASIAASWPAELGAERDLVIEHRVGPFARRAQKAVDALTDAGATPADLAALGTTWQQALSTRTQTDAVIELPDVDPALEPRLESAAAAFDAAVTPYASDPSLVVDSVETPMTDAYLAAHCPDVASSGVGDAL
jgi:hypothetical protein